MNGHDRQGPNAHSHQHRHTHRHSHGCVPLAGQAWYKRLHAWLLHAYAPGYNARADARKRALIGDLRGQVVEIGAGSGANIGYYGPGVHWTAVEPNRFAHAYLRQKAAAADLSADILDGTAETLPLPDDSQDAAVATLVLCTVADPARALAEIRRVLKPGGRFVFLEHVGDTPGTPTRRRQEWIRPVWRWAGDGCEPDRDTAERIRRTGFSRVDLEQFRMPYPIVGPHIAGVAVK